MIRQTAVERRLPRRVLPEAPMPTAAPDAVASAANAISDLELRAHFLEVAGRYLARFR